MFNTLTTKNQIKFKFQTAVIISMIAVWIFLLIFNVHPTQLNNNRCYFYYNYGVFCPGCGGTRAFESMLYGNFLKSFIYHPIVIMTVFTLLFSEISYLTYFVTRGKILFYELGVKHFIAIDLIFVINFLIKNLIVLYFNYYIF